MGWVDECPTDRVYGTKSVRGATGLDDLPMGTEGSSVTIGIYGVAVIEPPGVEEGLRDRRGRVPRGLQDDEVLTLNPTSCGGLRGTGELC